jgi:hypothetical protein
MLSKCNSPVHHSHCPTFPEAPLHRPLHSMLMYVCSVLWELFVVLNVHFLTLLSMICYHIDDEDGFCSFCALKEHIEESIQRSGSVLMPTRFKDNLSSIL